MKIVLASRSAHKAAELEALLGDHEVITLPDDVVLPPEDADTFAGNALGKARAAADATGLPAVGDDSGIIAAELDGAPGVRSARFAGEHATDQENLELLIERVSIGSPLAYHCALAFAEPGGEEFVVEARCTGTMAAAARGSGGFGYDPIFVADDDDEGRTMAELSVEEKQAISHRGRAAALLRERLEQ